MNKHCTYEQWKTSRWGINWSELIGSRDVVTAVEVGIGPLEISALPYFVESMVPCVIGIEANPDIAAKAKDALQGAEIINRAVWDVSGIEITLNENGGSSAVDGIWCPTRAHSGKQHKVQTIDFADFDSAGIIDVLNIDCEGCEHHVLGRMNSRPELIGIELWPNYPQAGWCEQWLLENNYEPIFATGPMSETHIWRLKA